MAKGGPKSLRPKVVDSEVTLKPRRRRRSNPQNKMESLRLQAWASDEPHAVRLAVASLLDLLEDVSHLCAQVQSFAFEFSSCAIVSTYG